MDTNDNFDNIVDLIRHNVDELVDEPDLVEITHTLQGNSGMIEICGPSDEIAKLMGSKKKNLFALNNILFSVASKYGFKVMLNVLNDEQKANFRSGAGKSGVTSVNKQMLDGPLL